jgi:hypothetical protein
MIVMCSDVPRNSKRAVSKHRRIISADDDTVFAANTHDGRYVERPLQSTFSCLPGAYLLHGR